MPLTFTFHLATFDLHNNLSDAVPMSFVPDADRPSFDSLGQVEPPSKKFKVSEIADKLVEVILPISYNNLQLQLYCHSFFLLHAIQSCFVIS